MASEFLNDAIAADVAHVWHPLTQHSVFRSQAPQFIVSGSRSTVVDGSGKEFLDCMAGVYCVNVGYGRKEIAQSYADQSGELHYYPHTKGNVPAALLAKRLAELAGNPTFHTYFVNSGTEANETAMKLARQYHRLVRPGETRYKFISRYYAYHGTSMATLSAGAIPERHERFEPLFGSFVKVPPTYQYRPPFGSGHVLDGHAYAQYLDYVIEAETPSTVAAVILEPIQTAIGVLVPPPDYLSAVQAVCRKHGVLLIVDEVINGFGRTGVWFGYQHEGIEPDLVCIAKGLTSGYAPLGAVMASGHVFEAFLGEPGQQREAYQISTWGGHPAACRAALENLRIMTEEDLPSEAAETGSYLMSRFNEIKENVSCVGDVRGRGLLIAIELVKDRQSKEPFEDNEMQAVVSGCLDRGVIVGRSAGHRSGLGNSLILSPPLVLTNDEADRVVQTIRSSLPT